MANRKINKKAIAPKTNGANELPAEFQLTELERIELENITLKQQLANQQMQTWATKTQANHGFALDNYQINPVTGICVLKTAPAPTPTPTPLTA